MLKTISFLCGVLFFIGGCGPAGTGILQWEFTGGPYAQNIATVHPDDKIPSTLYVGLTNGEILQSNDDGNTWAMLASPAPHYPLHQTLQDPPPPERLFAATDAGAFASTDRGKSWNALAVDKPGTPVLALTIDPWTPGVMCAGTSGRGIFRTTNGGTSWAAPDSTTDARIGMSDVYDIAVDPGKPNLLYAATSTMGLVKSTDGGISWRGITEEFTHGGARTTHVLLKKGSSNALLYATDAGNIARSVNGGESWIPSRKGQESDRILSLAAHPSNPDFLFAGTESGVIASTDFGMTWNAAGRDLPRIATHVVVSEAGPANMVYAYGNGIGVKASADRGVTWRNADTKLGGSTVRLMATDQQGDHLLVACGNTCLALDPGRSEGWVAAGMGITGGDISSITTEATQPPTFYVTTKEGVFQSNDAGSSWQSISRSLRIAPVLFETHPSIKTRLYASGDQGLVVSTDRGKTWTQPRPLGSQWRVHSLTFSPTNAGVILGATWSDGVVVSADGGFNWEEMRYGLPTDSIDVVTLDDKDPDVYYAYTVDHSCYRSLNKGLEWNRYAPPWRTGDTVRLAYDRSQPSSILALLNERQIYYSPSGGGTWFLLLEQGLKAEVVALSWNASSATAYAATRDQGVFRLLLGAKLREMFGE